MQRARHDGRVFPCIGTGFQPRRERDDPNSGIRVIRPGSQLRLELLAAAAVIGIVNEQVRERRVGGAAHHWVRMGHGGAHAGYQPLPVEFLPGRAAEVDKQSQRLRRHPDVIVPGERQDLLAPERVAGIHLQGTHGLEPSGGPAASEPAPPPSARGRHRAPRLPGGSSRRPRRRARRGGLHPRKAQLHHRFTAPEGHGERLQYRVPEEQQGPRGRRAPAGWPAGACVGSCVSVQAPGGGHCSLSVSVQETGFSTEWP
jgi:hypothetical protein